MKKDKDTASPRIEAGAHRGPEQTETLYPIRSRLTWTLQRSDQEVNKGKTLTQEDMSYSIKELLVRFTQGLPLNQGNGFYADGDDEPAIDGIDLEDFNRLDMSEQEEILEAVLSKRKVAAENHKLAEAEKLKAEREAKKARIQAKKIQREAELAEVLKRHQKS